MARRSPLSHRGRFGVIAVSLMSAAAGTLLLTQSSEIAGATGSGTSGGDRVIVCESGVVDLGDGGVEASSSVAYRVPDGVEVPTGCREG